MSRSRKIGATIASSKEEAIHLLDRCLTAHGMAAEEHDRLVVEVAGALDIRDGNTRLPTEEEAAEMKPSGCSVCGGQRGAAVHCNKCTRSYHMECMRPRPSRQGKEPKGNYICNQCVVEKKTGEVKESTHRSLRLQRRLMAGVSAGDEKDLEKVDKKDETVVTKTGKRYAVRKRAKGQIVEVARCDTLDEALHALMTEGITAVANKRKLDSDAPEGSLCAACFDDEAVQTCAFCGCRKCYGKHDSANILVCDGCEDEWHIYCLSPPLSTVPETSQWHCGKCKSKKEKGSRPRGRPPLHAKKKEEEAAIAAKQAAADAADPNAPPKPRGRGRPKGSKKQKDGTIASTTVASSAPPKPASTPTSSSGASVKSSSVKDSTNSLTSMDITIEASSTTSKETAPAPAIPAVTASAKKPQQDAVGIEAALAVISRAGFGKGLLPRDLEMLNQLRTWGPYSDLSTARDAALQHRDVLKRKIAQISAASEAK